MRARRLDMPATGRSALFALVAAAVVAAAVSLRHSSADAPAGASPVGVTSDPLAAALAHCQAMAAAAEGDGACEAAWAENRRRFFADGASAQIMTGKGR